VAVTFENSTAAGQHLTIDVTAPGVLSITAATAADGDTFSISEVVISRGIHGDDEDNLITYADITTSDISSDTLDAFNDAIAKVNSTRATLGASMSRLEYAADNLQNVSQDSSAARSRVLDADYASETTELACTQIIQQAGTAMLSQAYQAQQSVLSLLK
tara:strand:+ start:2045 stop:2524 length:480 start_codon:yes stop_codon:yes gene_type:complete